MAATAAPSCKAAAPTQEEYREAMMQMNMPPGHVILDTGCRTAVAGKLWHVDFQRALEHCGMEYFIADHEEIFRFGAGDPVLSTKAYIYPVQIYDHKSWVRIALVENTSTDSECPGLVGPAELARWKAFCKAPLLTASSTRRTDRLRYSAGWHSWHLETYGDVSIQAPDFGFAQYGITPESQTVAHQAFGRTQAAPVERSTLLRIGSRCPGQHL